MKELEYICFYCSNSMVTEENELYCVIKEKIIQDEEMCEDYN
jgi:hypothetical protein